jgi:hypothetical protein
MAINRENVLDQIDGIKDALTHGPWWQRLILVGTPVFVFFFIFWVRPLPGEIPEKLAHRDKSANAFFTDGVIDTLADYFHLVDMDGQSTVKSRKAWKPQLKEKYERYLSKGWTLEQTSKHVTFYWTGLWSLVETVEHTKVLTDRNKRVVYDGRFLSKLTWKKSDRGWFIHQFQLLEKEDDFTRRQAPE